MALKNNNNTLIHQNMRKTFILLSLLAVCTMASAQMTTRIVYVPGDGERQFGFNLIPSFSNQHLNPIVPNYDVDGTVNNLLGICAGIFSGYETDHGNFIEWGRYFSLYYCINPFVSKVTLTNKEDGLSEKHKVSHLDQRVTLHFNPFLSHRFNDQFSASLGLGLSFSPRLPGITSLDGERLAVAKDAESSILQYILNIGFDVNAGVKYWLSDEWFAGLRLQYYFGNVFTFLSKEKNVDNALKDVNGSLTLDLDKGTAKSMIIDKPSFQTVLSIGYCW